MNVTSIFYHQFRSSLFYNRSARHDDASAMQFRHERHELDKTDANCDTSEKC